LRKLLESLGDLRDHEADPELQLLDLKAGEVLFEQGEEGDSMYVLIDGVLGVRVRHQDGTETVIDKLESRAIVGEMALLSGQKRSATVFAVNDAALFRLTKSKFEQLTEEDQSALAEIDAIVAPRWQRLQLAEVLKDLFGDLDAASLHALQDQLEWLHLSNGDVLFRQGDAPDGMYIVVNGLLRITVTTPTGKDEVLGEIGRGETIGEFALMTDEVRTATIYVARETNVVRITPPVFRRLVRNYPGLMGKIAGGIVKRQQRILKPILEGIKHRSPTALTMALLPASSTVDTSRFAQELARALAPRGPAMALSSQQFDEAYGQPGASQSEPDDAVNPAIVAWMAELEASNKYLLL
jgi:CRP-like cAMP-binding protein